jgi:hypothetical protein
VFTLIETSRCTPLQRSKKRWMPIGTLAILTRAVSTWGLKIACACRQLQKIAGKPHT